MNNQKFFLESLINFQGAFHWSQSMLHWSKDSTISYPISERMKLMQDRQIVIRRIVRLDESMLQSQGDRARAKIADIISDLEWFSSRE